MIPERIKNIYDEHKGEHVISDGSVYRFIGISSDEMDCYYILWNGRKFILSTCVGRITPLKGYILDDHYQEMIRLSKLNHWDRILPVSLDACNEEIQRYVNSNGNKIECGPCWDLN